jgi:hypothetical protein
MESLFDKYFNEVKSIVLLPIEFDENGLKNPQKVIGLSIFRLFKLHIKSLIKFFLYYPLEVWKGRNFILNTIRLKNSTNNKNALVIGNGPSKGYLNVNLLDNFINSGGETIVVNNWASDRIFSKHVPSWIVFSDPVTFDPINKHSHELIDYLKTNSKIKILVPVSLLEKVVECNLHNSVYVFIDTECSFSKNINPLFPRGYLSMTLYKALAWANYLNYNKIGVIGMDNTYVRSLYSNVKNEVLEVQLNSGCETYVRNTSNYYHNMAARLDDLTRLFHHLSYFPKNKTFNLDIYSLTDRFDKMNFEKFF